MTYTQTHTLGKSFLTGGLVLLNGSSSSPLSPSAAHKGLSVLNWIYFFFKFKNVSAGATNHNNRPSAAVCTRCGLSAGARMAPQSRRCSTAHSARKRGLGQRPSGWLYDRASRRAKPKPPAPADTGCTPPDHTAAETTEQKLYKNL